MIVIPRIEEWHGKRDAAAVRKIWLEHHVIEQDNRCAYCRRSFMPEGDRCATVDHVIAKSVGGLDVFENTVAACYGCNTCKGNGTIDELFVQPSFQRRLLEVRSIQE